MTVRILCGIVATVLFGASSVFAQQLPSGEFTTITYPVADLVIPVSIYQRDEKTPIIQTAETELITRIHKGVAPASWDRAGGSGSLRFERQGGYLLHVRQSPAVHAELRSFLAKLQRQQISLDVRFLTISEKNLANRKISWAQNDDLEYALLDDWTLFQCIQAAQGEPTTHLLALPKVTLLDGQTSKVEVGDWLTFQTGADIQRKDGAPVAVPKKEKFFEGVQAEFLPKILSDGKHVAVQMDIVLRSQIGGTKIGLASVPIPAEEAAQPASNSTVQVRVEQPSFQEIKLAVAARVPDRRTIAFHVGKVATETTDFRPVIARIPYVNRLFRNQAVGQETSSLVILLTPRIFAEPEHVHVERLRNGIQPEGVELLPNIKSERGK